MDVVIIVIVMVT